MIEKGSYEMPPIFELMKNRAGLDEKAIRELFPEIAKEHEKVTVYDRVTVD